jgi:tetratricopeptide (TPR) repeat protein
MFRKIIAALLMVEGGLFIVAGLAPGMESTAQAYLSRRPDIISPNSLGEIVGIFPTLQRMMAMMGIICFAGGWGTLAHKTWARWVAILASALNLPLVPVFAPLGIIGFVAFAKEDPALGVGGASKSEKPMPISHLLVLLASLVMVFHLLGPMRRLAAAQGFSMSAEPSVTLQWILVGVFLATLLHETGHLVMAWAVGFQFREMKLGPLTLTERRGGSWAMHFSWDRMLMTGGYIRPIPQSLKGLKWNWILVVAAGPLTSLLMAMLGLLVVLTLARGDMAEYWPWGAYMATICLADCAANLLPLGVTDGAVIFHTVFGTQRGKGILAGLEAAMLNDKAERSGSLMDPGEMLETRRQALKSLEKDTETPGMAMIEQQIELARASLQTGKVEEAVAVLEGLGKSLRTFQEVPKLISFNYWVQVFDTATALGQYTTAAEARERGLQLGEELAASKMDWEDLVPIQVERAQMMMSVGDFLAAVTAIQETRATCPERRTVTAYAAELLAVEAMCELRLGRSESAIAVAKTAIAVSQELDESQRAKAMELLAHTAVSLTAAGDYELAQILFAAGVAGLEKSASPAVAAGYRTAWAESLYENGKLEEAARVVAPIDSAHLGFALDVEALRAQLFLAEDRPQEAIATLNRLLTAECESAAGNEKFGLARARALRSWALYRNGETEEALTDARKACDVLIPAEHPDAGPALLTLAMEAADNDPELADAYLQEGTRLICDAAKFTALTKASRLTDLARCLVQVRRRDWAKRLVDQAAKVRLAPSEKMSAAAGN